MSRSAPGGQVRKCAVQQVFVVEIGENPVSYLK